MQKTVTCFLFIILATAFSPTLKAQNLVPNPSFEDTVQCPWQFSHPEISQGWSNYRGSADYFNTCADYASFVSIPSNGFGYQYPHSGNAYMGAQCRFTAEYREFFGRQLQSPLIIGQKYFVSFYVNCAYGGTAGDYLATNKTGVLFSTIPYSYTSPAPINNFAHIYTNTIITDTLNWVLIKGSFIADSSYNYIILGNFFDDAHTDTIQLITGGGRAYYFFDDICVTTDSNGCSLEVGVKETLKEKEINIYPNPAHNQIEINGNDIQSLTLYDVLGRVIYTSTTEISSPFQLNTSSFSRGVYFLLVRGREGMVVRKVVLE